jgi:hypothetical protein
MCVRVCVCICVYVCACVSVCVCVCVCVCHWKRSLAAPRDGETIQPFLRVCTRVGLLMEPLFGEQLLALLMARRCVIAEYLSLTHTHFPVRYTLGI